MRGLNPASRVLVILLSLGLATPVFAADKVVRTFTFSPSDVSVQLDERGFSVISMAGTSPWGEVGMPAIPAMPVLVDLPSKTKAVSIVAEASGFVTIDQNRTVQPIQHPYTRAKTFDWVAPDATGYASLAWTSPHAAELASTGHLRGRTLASLRLFPIQYRAGSGEIRLATRIDVTIELAPSNDGLVRRRIVPEWEAQVDRAFYNSLDHGPVARRQGIDRTRTWTVSPDALVDRVERRGMSEPNAPTALPSIEGSPVQYLIITGQALEAQFESLATWKTEKGVPAVVRTTEFIAANYPFGVDGADRVRRFIRDAYSQWGTQYVLLAGDTDVVPFRYGRTTFFGGEYIASDLYFSDLDAYWNADGDSLFGEGYIDPLNPGDELDLLPDVWVGRAPVENTFEASTFLHKVLDYEKNPPPNFVDKALFMAEVMFPQEWSEGQTIALDGADIAEEAILRMEGLLEPTRMYENWMPKDSLGAVVLTRLAAIDSLNVGFNFLYHGGHGYRNSMSVGDDALTNPDITPLMNSPRTAGLLYAINCTSAAIDFESIGEEFILTPTGGSCATDGSTHFDFPTTGQSYQNEFFHMVFRDSIRNIGIPHAMQKVPFAGFATFDNVHRWTQFTLTLLGDPEMPFRTVNPVTFTVSHAASISLDDTTTTINVMVGGSPDEGARVCLLKDGEEYRVGYTNSSGDVSLSFRPQSTGDARLTVTSDNAFPYQADIPVVAASGIALIARQEDQIVTDTGGTTDGNGNGVVDYGETVDINLPVRNVGTSGTGITQGTLISLDNHVSVLDGSSIYGILGASGMSNGDTYQIAVSDTGIIDGDEVHLRLELDDGAGGTWREDVHIVVRVANLKLLSTLLADDGNSDQFLDIGETADYTITMINLTEGDARNVTATLEAFSPGVTVLNGSSTFPAIPGDGQAAGTAFQIQNNSAANPKFRLLIPDSYGDPDTLYVDFTPPDPPTSLKGTGSASTIALVWTKSDSLDLDGYNIFRSLNMGGPFSKVNYLPTGRTSYYLDEGLAALTQYYYYVTAEDSSGNESPQSTIISASTNPPTLNGFPIPLQRTTPSSPAVGDLDLDGRLEVVAGSDFLYAWHDDGQGYIDADGTARTSGDFTTQGNYYAAAPAMVDLDQDGRLEVVAPTWTSEQLFVYEWDGSVRTGFPVALGDAVWSGVAVGNMDSDPELEMVFNSNGDKVFAFNHDGTELIDGDSNGGTLGVFKVVGSSFNFSTPAVADLDGDDKLDAIVPIALGELHAWRFDGSSVPGFPYYAGGGGGFSSSPAIGDIDNDNKLEIVITAWNNTLHVIEEDGAVQAGFPVGGIPSGGNSRSPSPALVDMDGDGDHEILIARTDGQISILNHDGSFYPGWTAVRFSEQTSAVTESSPVAADLDGNGDLEILIGAEDGQLYALDSSGNPFPGFPIRLDGEIRGTPLVWDFTRDGQAEILLSGWDGNMHVWTYPGTFSHNEAREWVAVNHDMARTGTSEVPILIAVNGAVAYYQTTAIDGGVELSWRVPAEIAGEGGAWQVYRTQGTADVLPGILEQVPEGFLPLLANTLVPGPDGWISFSDFTVLPGESYQYILALVAGGADQGGVAYGPYNLLAPDSAPERAFLATAYPNPGGSGQTISYGIPSTVLGGSKVKLDLYNVRGAKVRTLVNRSAQPGRFVVTWDGTDDAGRLVPGGVYLYRLAFGSETLNGRLVRLQQ